MPDGYVLGKVQMASWMPLKPLPDELVLVGGLVIHDQMQLQDLAWLPVYLFQKVQPVLMPVMCFDAADHNTLP